MLALRRNALQNMIMLSVLFISGALNFMLARQVKNDFKVIHDMKAAKRLGVGTKVPNIAGKSPDGKPIEINFATLGKPTILYVFTPTCGWCKRNFNNMMALHRNVEGRYAFVGVSLTSADVAKYVKQQAIDYQVVDEIPDSVKDSYKLGGTPTTIVVSPDNKVLKIWFGAYDGQLLTEVSNYFEVSLPGLTPRIDETPVSPVKMGSYRVSQEDINPLQ